MKLKILAFGAAACVLVAAHYQVRLIAEKELHQQRYAMQGKSCPGKRAEPLRHAGVQLNLAP